MIAGCRACLVDVEGTLIRSKGGTPVEGAETWLSELHDQGIPTLLVTNNTTASAEETARSLRDVGFRVQTREILSCLDTATQLLAERELKSLLVIGSDRLKELLAERGFLVEDRPDVDAVVVGLDLEVDYAKLSLATQALEDQARLVALHTNPLYRDPQGRPGPGVGAFVQALEYATGCKALLAGKPSPFFFRQALSRVDCSPGETIMISDDPLGDLRGARAVGLRTVFVLSGKYPDPSILDRLSPKELPEEVAASVADIEFWS